MMSKSKVHAREANTWGMPDPLEGSHPQGLVIAKSANN